MAQPKEVSVTINGQQVRGKEGNTVLDMCHANNIYVPTLCFLEGLSNVGACRLCVVDIEGERRINPACTYPARDGLVIKTHTPKLEQYRRQTLELIFTERNHFCFFCTASGECELQALAYRYQMDHARYPYTFPNLPADTLNDFLVIDHNRCILCGRCVRVCSEVVGNHTLDFGRRGWRTVVTADLSQSLGESSCISCGACVQACPTGAIFSKASAYRGKVTQGKTTRSLCSLCGVGCDTDVLVKDNNIIRIDGAGLTGPKGQLCVMGRFQQLYKEKTRIATPMVSAREGGTKASSWSEALDRVATEIRARLDRYGAGSVAGLVSSSCPSETLEAFANLMRGNVGTSLLDTLDGTAYRTLAQGITAFSKNGRGLDIESPLEAILEADCVLLAGANVLKSHPVAGCYILRAKAQKGAQLLVIDPSQNDLGVRSDLWLRPTETGLGALIKALIGLVPDKAKGGHRRKVTSVPQALEAIGLDAVSLEQAANMLSSAQNLVVVYGDGILGKKDPGLVADLLELGRVASPAGLKVVSLKPRGNSRGAWEMGIASDGLAKARPRLVYILLSDDEVGAEDWVRQAEQAEFLVVQASYASPLTEAADVVLPSRTWAERAGKYVALDGKAGRSQAVLEPPSGTTDDVEVIAELALRL